MNEEPGSRQGTGPYLPVQLAILPRSTEWGRLQAVLEERFTRAVIAVLHAVGQVSSKRGELNLVLADDTFQRELNRTYRGIDKSTNVLAFGGLMNAVGDPSDSPAILGDIVLAFETCAAEAESQGKRLEDHALHLAIHGLLHLLGYTHEEAEDAHVMEELERKVLASFDIPDPYADISGTSLTRPDEHANATSASAARINADG